MIFGLSLIWNKYIATHCFGIVFYRLFLGSIRFAQVSFAKDTFIEDGYDSIVNISYIKRIGEEGIMKLSKIVALLLFVTLLSGCIPSLDSSGKGKATPTNVGIFKIEYQTTTKEVTYGDGYFVSITNLSSECIVFPTDFGLVYSIEGDNTLYKDGTIYQSTEEHQLDPAGMISSTAVISLFPILPNEKITQKTEIGATINGHYCSNPQKKVSQEISYYLVP